MADRGALRARRARLHKRGDCSLCRHNEPPPALITASALHRVGDHSLCDPLDLRHGKCSVCGKTITIASWSAPPERRACLDCRRLVRVPYGPRPGSPGRSARPVPLERICALCEQPYTPKPMHRPDQRWCSKSCAQAWRNGARPPYVRVGDTEDDGSRAARQRLRHRRRAETWDGVTREQILERDGWRCGICGKRIGKSFKYPHPRSASIDHIVPLSQGGDDTAANKRAAHLCCNCGRMNCGGGEQLAMIG